jgi:uncharacterized membrane protein YhaH (DUF805 family)
MNQPDGQPVDHSRDRVTFLRLFAASFVGLTAGYLTATAAVVLLFLALVSFAVEVEQPEDLLRLAVVLIAIIFFVGFAIWSGVTVLVSRLMVNAIGRVKVEYWKVALALIPVAILAFLITIPITMVITGDNVNVFLSPVLQFVAAPAVSAVIISSLSRQ